MCDCRYSGALTLSRDVNLIADYTIPDLIGFRAVCAEP